MSRIRTVKPDLFRHEELFDAELESGLPLRLAFIGMLTAVDCEGRFQWKPRTLKLDVLPHDTVDFSAILDALERHGFIESYTMNGAKYGHIPSFKRHQQIPTKEAERGSALPPPPEKNEPPVTNPEPIQGWACTDSGSTPNQFRAGHVPESQEGKGRGKEGEGERKGEEVSPHAATPAPSRKTACPPALTLTPELQAWATEHGYHEDLNRHLDHFKDKAIAKGYQYADWQAALRNAIRDDWANLRSPSPSERTAATSLGRAPAQKARSPDPRVAEVEAILAGIKRPVIEGECSNVTH